MRNNLSLKFLRQLCIVKENILPNRVLKTTVRTLQESSLRETGEKASAFMREDESPIKKLQNLKFEN